MRKALFYGALAALLMVVSWHVLPAATEAGWGGGRCGTSRQRIQIEWKPLVLAEQTGGAAYGKTALPVEDCLKNLHSQVSASSQPSVVWFCDVTDDATVKKIDGSIMRNEAVGIALKRYNCYRVNVLDMPEGELKDKYLRETPAFYFFDPAGAFVKDVSGKRATSLSGFNRLMEYTWDMSYTMRLKDFSKGYKKILDEFDKMDVQKQNVARKREKLEERPNPRTQRQLEQEEAELNELKAKIEEEEKALLEECKLQPEYLPAEAAEDSE